MSLIDDELSRAETGSADARHRLAKTVAALQTRLKPSAIARDAVQELNELGSEMARAGVDTIKRNPVRTAGVVAAFAAFVARKPLFRLFRRRPDNR